MAQAQSMGAKASRGVHTAVRWSHCSGGGGLNCEPDRCFQSPHLWGFIYPQRAHVPGSAMGAGHSVGSHSSPGRRAQIRHARYEEPQAQG